MSFEGLCEMMYFHTFGNYVQYFHLFAVIINLHLEVQLPQSDGEIIK